MKYDESLLAQVAFKANGAINHNLATLIGSYRSFIDISNMLEDEKSNSYKVLSSEVRTKKIAQLRFNAECTAKGLRIFVSSGKVIKIEDLELDRS